MKKEVFNVTGMTCSACSARVEKAVAKLPGTEGVVVNLLTNSLRLSYDESQVDAAGIIRAVEAAGYGAAVKGAKAEEDMQQADGVLEREARAMKGRLLWSVVFLVPLM